MEESANAYVHSDVHMFYRFDQDADRLAIAHFQNGASFDLWREIGQLSASVGQHLLIRDKIVDLTLCENYVAARSKNGLVGLYDIVSAKFVKYMNEEDGEIIRSVHYNSLQRHIVPISLYHRDMYKKLHIKATPLANVYVSEELFQEFSIGYPGFIELDSMKGTGIIYEGRDIFNVVSMENYQILYSQDGRGVKDMKLTHGSLLSLHHHGPSEVKISFIDHCYNTFVILPIKQSVIEVIDRVEYHLILKQRNEDMIIYDLSDNTAVTIPNTAELQNNQFMFLYLTKQLLVFSEGRIHVYTFSGQYIFTIQAERPFTLSPISPSLDQKYLVVTSQDAFDQWIYIFSTVTGEKMFERYLPPRENNGYRITSVAFDSARATLVIGDAFGRVTLWQ